MINVTGREAKIHDSDLRGADAVYVAAAEYLNLPLCTLDEDQARRVGYRVEVRRLEVDGV